MADGDEDATRTTEGTDLVALSKEEPSGGSNGNRDSKADEGTDAGPDHERDAQNAVIIQRLFRKRLARRNLIILLKSVYEKVYDESTGAYFYYNNKTGESQWTKPINLGKEEVNVIDDGYVEEVNGESYKPEGIDPRVEDGSVAQIANESKEIFEQGTGSLAEVRDDPNSIIDDTRAMVPALDPENSAGEEEGKIEAALANSRVERKPNHKDWNVEDVCDFFKELELEEYIPALQKFKVNGPLLYTLTLQDYKELGIFSNLRIRRIRYELQKYYIKKTFKDESDSDNDEAEKEQDELALLEMESNIEEDNPEYEDEKEGEDDYGEESETDDDEGEDMEASDSDATTDSSVDEDERRRKFLTEDDLNEMAEDESNITLTRLVQGDGVRFPAPGDIVTAHIETQLENGTVVFSSRHANKSHQGKPIEFMVGRKQVIKGIDRGISMMSCGERATLEFSAEYGYGKYGLSPLVPPNAKLIVDVDLIKYFRPKKYKRVLLETRDTAYVSTKHLDFLRTNEEFLEKY